MRIESCVVCLEDLGEHVEAKYRCNSCGLFYCLGDGKRHTKKHPDHIVEGLNIRITNSNLSGLVDDTNCEVCKDHNHPINSYCRNCDELICAVCALDSHKKHDCYLVDQIYNDEKIKFRVDLETLKRRVSQFENTIGGEKQLEDGIIQIEKRRIAEEENIDKLLDNIITKANERRDYLKKVLNQLAEERTGLLLETMEIKNTVEREALIHLDRLEEMSKIELMKNKITLLKKVNTGCDKMLCSMRFRNIKHVQNFCLETDKETLNLVLDLIENLGSVNPIVSTTYQVNHQLNSNVISPLPAEFYYERDYITREDTQFKKKSHTEHTVIMSSKKLSVGIFKWRVHLNVVRNWIGIGVCQESLFDNKDFKNFKSPYLDHKIDMISSNGYVWSCAQRILNHTQKGFFFTSSEDVECELNCDTKTLTFKKGMNIYCIREIQLPVYPVIVLLDQNDSASIYL